MIEHTGHCQYVILSTIGPEGKSDFKGRAVRMMHTTTRISYVLNFYLISSFHQKPLF
jgi:hypothetical protein